MLLKFQNAVLFLAVLLSGCNSQTNILGRTVPDEHKDSFFYHFDMARILYDQGKLLEARKHAKKAFEQDPDSEDASILLGYIDLSLAGGDPFSLAKALIAAENEKKKQSDGAGSDSGGTGESSTADTLGSIKTAIGVTPEELELLGTRDESDPEFPVMIPRCVEDVRVAVDRLNYVNEAIRAVCPFVDPDIRSEADYRQICDETTVARKSRAKAHFLWAFAHLTEAIAFNAILTFANPDATDRKSNLERRVQKIQTSDTGTPAGIATLLESLKGVESTVNAIFPAGGVCSETAPTSQLRATLNDMLAVDIAFSRIAGMPDGIVNSIKKLMSRINGDGSDDGVGSKLTAMKSDFTKKMGSGLSSKVDELASDPNNPLPDDQKDQICSVLGSISPGADGPTACNK